MKISKLVSRIRSYYPDISQENLGFLRKSLDILKESPSNTQETQWQLLELLLPLKPDIQTIVVALLSYLPKESIEDDFGEEIQLIHKNLQKLSKIKYQTKNKNPENLNQILIIISQDIRVLLIHLGKAIQELKSEAPQKTKEQRAYEAKEIYAPLAEKLDMYIFKATLEDLSFEILNPEIFKAINDELSHTGKIKTKKIQELIESVKKHLIEEDMNFITIEGRIKNIYSVYEKMRRKNFSSVREIYDVFAIRIITNSANDCYKILGALHTNFTPMPNRFKDYIAIPKPNGYQSLHTTLLGLDKGPTEIQIQTFQMYQEAKFGKASHWAYKKAKNSNYSLEFLTQHGIKQALDGSSTQPLIDRVNQDRIHVFTPKGDIISLPENSTPVDFAYAIHSQVGESIVNAKINGNIRPLDHPLKAGDIIEVISKKGRKPNPLWLKFVKSRSARHKIRHYLNQIRHAEELPPKPEKVKKVFIKKPKRRFTPFFKDDLKNKKILIGGETDIPFKYAKCCKPRLHHSIIAYNSRGLEFMIHKNNCKILTDLESQRFMDAKFLQQGKIQITHQNDPSASKSIFDIFHENKITPQKIQTIPHEGNTILQEIEFEYHSEEKLDHIINAINKEPYCINISLEL